MYFFVFWKLLLATQFLPDCLEAFYHQDVLWNNNTSLASQPTIDNLSSKP